MDQLIQLVHPVLHLAHAVGAIRLQARLSSRDEKAVPAFADKSTCSKDQCLQ
jgi:hypothetical protein